MVTDFSCWIFNSLASPLTSNGFQFQKPVYSVLIAEGLARSSFLRPILSASLKFSFNQTRKLIIAINLIIKLMSLYGILSDIESLSSIFDFCIFTFISRKHNKHADSLAKTCVYNCVSTAA
ncbi:LOW QUALITY PROTEIN: hypothetical protein HID58_077711 [Brassica napus]|uniref:RNase H type-1 domain-containing protein n=1 Tax=Brassica napus TaxID=3708 RepID=A0ABQ7YS79_BRANA|nr:LOW QUALITY PROTEIN: hypothetical protein HID58_077711 [Brassica napus]